MTNAAITHAADGLSPRPCANRRTLLTAGLAGAAAATLVRPAPVAALTGAPAGTPPEGPENLSVLDPVRTELVMNLVVTCSSPERMGASKQAKDGTREVVWPIIGGRFWGPRLKGEVVPGGGDFPVLRPDGTMVVDALYRLRVEDGTQVIIHNKGLAYRAQGAAHRPYRLVPTFTTVEGPHDWLQSSIFVATLVYGEDVPAAFRLAQGPEQNDRLIQVHRIF
ncbi:DUF3237 domain-containing protein [Novosphingobium sp. 1949]|uniref:DUF3237 domain-containing protein n=1 Tax=Novosphingobium organovorum TaxID=2930092 RepID=A0ABT0BAV0_9SPHN|nr:DUF3237 domain-containing protein [Novosphingobium organovorum]MCJ2182158.1 DUF3237 domain-containing protein [Novosphingobium organovorum]